MDHKGPIDTVSPEFATDLLRGADEIGNFLFGESGNRRRKVYYLASTSRLPVFRLGSMLCARRSALLEHFGRQEMKAAATSGPDGKAR